MKKSLVLTTFLFCFFDLFSQSKYNIDASNVMLSPLKNIYDFDNLGPAGREIEVNSLYMTIGGKPVLPIMGEMHFSQINHEQWEDYLLKMKACGVNIIAFYLFWNQHEEIEGQFDWDDDKDVRSFIELCKKHDLYVFPRIGPWVHGEARHGGTPDWILTKNYIKNRSNDPVYQSYVKRYFTEMAAQMSGLTYEEGGPIIGLQLDNEYQHHQEGEAHIMWLKNTIKDLGLKVPLFTVTAWAGGSAPAREVIPIWGAYSDGPWDSHVNKNVSVWYFKFNNIRANVAANLLGTYTGKIDYINYDLHPYFNAEIGAGIQNTYHRRLVLDPTLAVAMPTLKIGEGASLIGYYIFAGATHPRGKLRPTGESWEVGNYTTVPTKNYNFQAPIRETGEISQGYRKLKNLHYFCNKFGEIIAPMLPTNTPSPNDGLQLTMRSNNKSGFLVGLNFCRYIPREAVKKPSFSIKMEGEVITFPPQDIIIPDSTVFIWPVNFDLDGCVMKYATAQLLSRIGDYFFLFQNKSIAVEVAFDNSTIDEITSISGSVRNKNEFSIINNLQPGKDCIITLKLKNGTAKHVVVLSEKDAENTWIFEREGKEELFICPSGYMYDDGQDVYVMNQENKAKVYCFDEKRSGSPYQEYNLTTVSNVPDIEIKPHLILDDAQWLEVFNYDSLSADQVLRYKAYFKEFCLENPSKLKRATLYLYPESECFVNINDLRVNQEIVEKKLNTIDITGYITKGDNMMNISFPLVAGGQKIMAARIIVEYYNYDRVNILTDQSWLTTDTYPYPSLKFNKYPSAKAPSIIAPPAFAGNLSSMRFNEWDINVPVESLEGLSSLYFHLKYAGDIAELYNGHVLAADDFNNNTFWGINLKRLENNTEGKKLRLVIYPLKNDGRKFFDNPPASDEYGAAKIKSFNVIPEYKMKLKL